MSKGFKPGTVVFDTDQNEVARVVQSDMLHTVAVTLDGAEEIYGNTEAFEKYTLPTAS